MLAAGRDNHLSGLISDSLSESIRVRYLNTGSAANTRGALRRLRMSTPQSSTTDMSISSSVAGDDDAAGLLSSINASSDSDDSDRLDAIPLRAHGGSAWIGLVNLVKGFFGAGILAVAKAFTYSGLPLGVVLYLAVGIAVTVGSAVLVSLKHELNLRGKLSVVTFADVAQTVLGPWGRVIVFAEVVFLQLAFCSGFIVVILDQLHVLGGISASISTKLWVSLVLAVPLGLFACIRWLKDLWFVSSVGLVVYVFGIVGLTLFEASSRISRGVEPPVVPLSASSVMEFLGIAIYAIEGINLILPVERSLRHPTQATAVTWSGMLAYTGVCTLVGAMGFAAGMGSCDLVSDCFDPGPSATVVRVALIIALLASHPLQLFPATEILERKLQLDDEDDSNTTNRNRRWMLRGGLALLTCLVGATVPDFQLFAGLVGSMVMTLVGFSLPFVLYLRVFWGRLHWAVVAASGLCILFGLVTCVFGTITSVRALVQAFS
jgi:solute carrier family 36 (proton-coupled amino acid transporter)